MSWRLPYAWLSRCAADRPWRPYSPRWCENYAYTVCATVGGLRAGDRARAMPAVRWWIVLCDVRRGSSRARLSTQRDRPGRRASTTEWQGTRPAFTPAHHSCVAAGVVRSALARSRSCKPSGAPPRAWASTGIDDAPGNHDDRLDKARVRERRPAVMELSLSCRLELSLAERKVPAIHCGYHFHQGLRVTCRSVGLGRTDSRTNTCCPPGRRRTRRRRAGPRAHLPRRRISPGL